MKYFPTVHLNGTSKSELMEQARNAVVAIDAAIAAVKAASPHGRDYYPQASNPLYPAIDERNEMITKLYAMRGEFFALWEHIDEQGNR